MSATVAAFRRLPDVMRWEQGEHTTLLGRTGSGKSEVATRLLELRGWVVAIFTKRRDPTIDALKAAGYVPIRSWPPPAHVRRVILWVPFAEADDEQLQAEQIGRALREIIAEGAWTVYVDELPWLQRLGLTKLLEAIWLQGRSIGLSLVACAQRPFGVPQAALSQATHLLIWGSKDRRDLDRLAEISGGVDKAKLREIVADLPAHAFAYVNTRNDSIAVSRAVIPRQPRMEGVA